jgi:hypothetical protein
VHDLKYCMAGHKKSREKEERKKKENEKRNDY